MDRTYHTNIQRNDVDLCVGEVMLQRKPGRCDLQPSREENKVSYMQFCDHKLVTKPTTTKLLAQDQVEIWKFGDLEVGTNPKKRTKHGRQV